MIRHLAPAALLACALAAPANANDPRLVERLYMPDEVVTIHGRTNVQATIEFGEDERIENVAIGDSASWQVTPNKRANLLFVKPLAPKAATNMTVVTSEHTYLFDLVASPKANALYVLRFTYPEKVEEEGEDVQLAEAPTAMEMQAATDPYAVTDPVSLNHDWAATGDQNLVPARTYDDGQATFLTWPAGRAVPAILVTDHEGTEGPVNYAVRGDTIVVDGVPRTIILRSGEDAATLVNQGPARPVASANDAALARAGENR